MLGKFAGFGVAKHIVVTSRKEGEPHATRIVLDFDEIRKATDVSKIKIPKTTLADGGGIEPHGTTIRLTRLLFEPVKSRAITITRQISEHFQLILPAEFAIRLNGEVVPPPPDNFAFAYPDRDDIPKHELVAHSIDTESGPVTFNYRLRFTGDNEALPAQRRGIRVYAHLACSPESEPVAMRVFIGPDGPGDSRCRNASDGSGTRPSR